MYTVNVRFDALWEVSCLTLENFCLLVRVSHLLSLIILNRPKSHVHMILVNSSELHFLRYTFLLSIFYISTGRSYKMIVKILSLSFIWYLFKISPLRLTRLHIIIYFYQRALMNKTKIKRLPQRRKRKPSSVKIKNTIACRFRPWVALKKRLDQRVNLYLHTQWLTKLWPISAGFS